MATATFGPQGKIRAINSISEGKDGTFPRILIMNTFPESSTTPDPIMQRMITWSKYANDVRSTNKLPVKTATANSEYEGALLFPIAAGRKFSNMTLHLNESQFPLLLTFVLEGAESTTVSYSGGAAKLVGQIKISF